LESIRKSAEYGKISVDVGQQLRLLRKGAGSVEVQGVRALVRLLA
jgi:hypothetical protein